MKGDRIPTEILATRIIADMDRAMARRLGVSPENRAVALLTTTCDDVTYVALDEATKHADVEVAFGKSFYAGAGNASTKLAGEVLGILAAREPAMVRDGLRTCLQTIREQVCFYSANEDDSILYMAHCISRTGSYMSAAAGIPEGEPLAYLIAPPLEAMFGVDAALKAAAVRLCVLYEPPTQTNFGGALLTGSQAACQAACEAFAAAVTDVADRPEEQL